MPSADNVTPPGGRVSGVARAKLEKATDDLRQVRYTLKGNPETVYFKVQRRWVVECGEAKHVMEEPPPPNIRFRTLPGQALVWVPVRDEWRDLPEVDANDLT